ncbi:uncharacterized protein LOC131222487 isoform X2 [Magnolia sinica]|uniref:uncharacterized protein LOC131222487 isoform X2 n=1 Tax=Magnolia sinica TaxID=86752 RepID=UPI002659018C|nr:uncharacterized protein LOC131222487 isoform X2 [Magnolia sinica]
MDFLIFFDILLFVSAFSGRVLGKECTNTPTERSSHTLRYELLSSVNGLQKDGTLISYDRSILIDEFSTLSRSIPRKVLREEADEFDRQMLDWSTENPDGLVTGRGKENFLKGVSLHDVRLDSDSMHGQAQQTNLEYLLMLDVDSLVWSFRKTAGLQAIGTPYGGWEKPTGHYMSASAQMWASTHNGTLCDKMSALVSALDACQKKMGTGYLSAFPSELFDRFEAIEPVWAPYYTIHKIMAGLLEQYLLAGNDKALEMVVWMADYFSNRVQNVISKYSLERHWLSLNEETGGMNDVLYKLYSITGDQKHLVLAHLFDKPCFLGLLAVQADSLSGFHANTHIPVVIGAQMRYEVTGDPLYKAIGTFFMDIVNSSHSYATGGTSVSEFWSDPKRLADTLRTENQESCTTYNMLKVARHLFRWTKDIAYADYYERALTNGVLGIQRGTEPGVMIYMLPQGRGKSKAHSYHGWGTKFNSFWCCYGTGIESFSKLGDSIYFEERGDIPGLYIIQFVSSSVNWKYGRITLNQKVKPVTSSDPNLRVSFSFSVEEGVSQLSTLYIRIPSWTYSNGAKATLNDKSMTLPFPGNFFSITKKWDRSDRVSLQLPIALRTEAIKDDRLEYASIQAILFGPYLLAGLSNGDWDIKQGTGRSLSDWITAVPACHSSQLISLTQESGNTTLVFTNLMSSITMEKLPESGTDAAIHATFRLISKDPSTSQFLSGTGVIGKSVMLEPFDLPGMVVAPNGPNNSLAVTPSGSGSDSGSGEVLPVFRVVAGLDRKANTISLESETQRGCFVCGGGSVQLSCWPGEEYSDLEFRRAASFTLSNGMSRYHPLSFVTKGATRNFLLMPLLSLRDESYTVYFNVGD